MVADSEFLAPRAEKCRVVPFGLPAQRLTATPAARRRAAELRAAHAGRQIVLFVGRLVYYKGVDVLVRAMAGVDADLVLIGRGPLEAELRELAAAQRDRRARDLPRRRRTTTSSPPGTTPPTSSACRAWPAARPSASCRSRRTPRARRSCPPTCPPASRTPISTASPGSSCRRATRRRSRRRSTRLLGDDELRARLGRQARDARAHASSRSRAWSRGHSDVYAEAVDGMLPAAPRPLPPAPRHAHAAEKRGLDVAQPLHRPLRRRRRRAGERRLRRSPSSCASRARCRRSTSRPTCCWRRC